MRTYSWDKQPGLLGLLLCLRRRACCLRCCCHRCCCCTSCVRTLVDGHMLERGHSGCWEWAVGWFKGSCSFSNGRRAICERERGTEGRGGGSNKESKDPAGACERGQWIMNAVWVAALRDGLRGAAVGHRQLLVSRPHPCLHRAPFAPSCTRHRCTCVACALGTPPSPL